MSTVNVKDLITNLLNQSFVGRVDSLEKRFDREANDISNLEVTCDVLKKNLKDCDVLMEAFLANLEAANRAATEAGASKAQAKGREKSVGASERGKSLAREKSVGKGLGAKTKTVTNLKKPENSKSLPKNKSTANITKSDSTKTLPKTPKGKSGAKTSTQTPEKNKPTKGMTKTPTQGNLKTVDKGDNEKTLKKNATAGKGLMKSGTKGNLLKGDKGKSATKAEPKSDRKSSEVIQTHPKREDNISATIGVGVTNPADELLTKEDSTLPNEMTQVNQTEPANNSSTKLDLNEILDDRWNGFSKYWNRLDHCKILMLNKVFGKLSITHLISDLQKEIIENEAKIKALRDKNSPEDLNKEQNPFALTRGALKAVELLNESLYFKLFTDSPVPCEDIILTYRIFFQLLNMNDYVNIKDTNEFWKKTCEYFVKESEQKLGTFVQNLVKNIDFSNENIYKLTRLVGNNLSKITPNYFSKMCGTTGLFIFLIKDSFEYAGILVDKKTPPARLYKNYMYVFEVLQGKIERLKKIQAAHFS